MGVTDFGAEAALALGYVLGGAAGEFFTRGGQRDIDESFLVMMNAYYGDLDFRFPHLSTPLAWEAFEDYRLDAVTYRGTETAIDGGSGSSSSTLCIVTVDDPLKGRSPVRN